MIFSRHSVLKRGCSTWDKAQMPQAEFESRLEAVRQEMAQRKLDALVIYGDNYAFGDLCYLTNYFPKVRGGIGVVPHEGSISLLLNIGSRDVPFAKSLTWVEDVRASNQVGRDGAALLKEKGFANATVGLVDSGQGFPLPQLEEMKEDLPQVEWEASHSMLQPMRRQKSARELAALRGAGRVLKEICEEARAVIQQGRKEYEVIADIDRAARNKGVEDIHIMAGERRLQPPRSGNTAVIDDHWTAHFAIQYERYWVEAGRTYILTGESSVWSAYQRAREVVGEMASQLEPGNAAAAIDKCARRQLGEFYSTAALYGLGNGIGLDQWEAPFLSGHEAREVGLLSADAGTLEENMALALRVIFESDGKLILFGDSFEVTASGAALLTE